MSDLAQTLSWIQDETRLVSELQSGSDTAFDWLVTYYHASVYNVSYGILADRADAADVTQEVFLKVFRGINGFRHGSSLKTWLYRIAIREALNHRRWWHRHCRNEVSIDASLRDDGSVAQVEDVGATPYETLASSETQTAVRNALAELPEVYRSAVILRDLEGLSYEEVAEVLETSVGTVKTRILRGRRALKALLEPLLRAPNRSEVSRAAVSASCAKGGVSRKLGSYGAILLDGERGG
jgi:RNA polymerase sigma-70 factor, ECF subfamily